MSSSIVKHLLNFLFPTSCLICKKIIQPEKLMCDFCLDKQPFLLSKKYAHEKIELNLFSLFNYEKPFSQIITTKFIQDKNLLTRTSKLFLHFLPKEFFTENILVPIPIHWSRYIFRGFNQAELISLQISKLTKCLSLNLLNRKKKTLFQADLTAKEREKNLENAFAIENKYKSIIKNNSFILVDDLCTTGTTLLAATKVLKSAGAKSIKAVSICRT